MRKTVIIGAAYLGILGDPLRKLGYEVLPVPDNPFVDERLKGHSDLSVFSFGDGRILLSEYLRSTVFASVIENMGFRAFFEPYPVKRTYPYDCALNALMTRRYLIYSEGITSGSITFETGLKHIPVRQGYVRCTVLPAGDDSIITSDTGIAASADEAGLEVLRITPGYIDLAGFGYGFIGGSAIPLPDNTIAFTGSLDRHPDKGEIIGFLQNKSLKPVFLTDRPLFDIGGGTVI